ncbi:hypothetical protein EDC04DRAFT_2877679 [Pisolithus marmoratus]|nr:hypothetical protein EDC04DRAFT_2877679 [Pisolithus marmoratus]
MQPWTRVEQDFYEVVPISCAYPSFAIHENALYCNVSSLLSEVVPPKPKFTAENVPDMTRKVVLITGANAGIGKETARVLLLKNAEVWIGCRDVGKGEATIRDIKDRTGREAHLLKLNPANLRSIKESAESFLSKETQLPVLFNNAGVMNPPVEQVTDDGFDLQFGTNVLGHFYLTKLLLPLLLSTAKTSPDRNVRVVNTSSNGHWFSGLDFDTFKDGPKRRAKSGMALYGQSKAGNIVFSAELHRRYRDQGVVSTSLNPGGIRTEIARHQGGSIQWIFGLLMYDVSHGAITQLFAGTSRDAVGLGGQYLIPWARIGKPRADTQDPQLGKKLWTYMEEQVAKL